MEKWVRGLSKTNALIIGIAGIVGIIAIYAAASNFLNGFISLILACALLGGGVGFSVLMLFKGITGYTPQERKELNQKQISG